MMQEPLMEWFFKLREACVQVNVRFIVLKAVVLDPEFAQRLLSARYQAMQQRLKANCITIQAGTWVQQQNSQDMFDEALAFVQKYMRAQLSALNMDQTPVYFLMAPRTALNLMGESTIHMASTDGSTTRLSVTVGVTASGKLFKPMLTLKEPLPDE